MESIVQFLTVLFIFVFVLVITYLTTRWIGNYQKTRCRGVNIELLDAGRLSQGQYIQIVRIGSRYLALAVGRDSVTVLCTLEEDELSLNEDPGSGGSGTDFKKLLSEAAGRLKAGAGAAGKQSSDGLPLESSKPDGLSRS